MSKKNEENDAEEEEEDTDTDEGESKGESDSSSSGEFEQKDLDRVAGKARGEGNTAGQKEVLTGLGFDSIEDAEAYLKTKRSADEAELSEIDKLKGQVETSDKRFTDAESALEAEKSSGLTQKLKSAVMLEIVSNTELNIHPKALDDIWSALVDGYLGDGGIHVDENGKIQGVAKGVEKLLKAKPYFTSTPDEEENPSSDTRQKRDTVGKGERIEDEHNPKYGKFKPNPRL